MAQHFRTPERQETEATELPDGLDVMPESVPDVPTGQDAPLEATGPLDAPAADATSDVMALPLDDPLSEEAPVVTPTPDAGAVPDPFAAPVTNGAPEAVADPFAYQPTVADVAPAPAPVPAPAPAPASVVAPAPAIDRTGEPAISLQHVSMIYPAQPNKPALDDISVDIYSGEFVFIVGHSGSGKSTFIRLLNRELRATKGKVFVGGQDLGRLRNRKVPFLRRQLGCVFQDFKLLPDKTVAQNVAFALECIGKPKSLINAQVPEVLRLVGLAEKMDSYPDQLSGGEQQRVAIARAMVNRPPLLICDEPTGNLDPAISLGIMKLLDAINRNGTTVVMATHDRQMVDAMQRRVIQLDGGQLVRDQEGGYGVYNIEGGETYYV